MQVHEGSKNYICETCGKAFSKIRSLDLHMVIHSGVKNYSCKTCNKQFARKGEVEDHERTHTGEKPFQCEICGSTFSQRSNLQSHKRATHYEEKKHQCEKCNRAFKRRRLLVYHMMSVHTGERPFKCENCSAAFVYPEHYKKHLRIHTGEKPFECDICGKAFNSRDNRNAHKFIHSERKPYECTICTMGFMRKPMLLTHLLQHGSLSSQPELCIRVNPSTVADVSWPSHSTDNVQSSNNDFITTDPTGLRIPQGNDLDGSSVQLVSSDTMEVVSRPVHIIEAEDLPRYILQSNERGGPFLASIQGQVVEVRPDALQMRSDGIHYQFASDDGTESTVVTAGSNNAAGDGLSGDGTVRSFQLHLGTTDDDADELELQSLETNESGEVTIVNGVAVANSDNNALLSRSFQFDTSQVVESTGTMTQLRSIKVLTQDAGLNGNGAGGPGMTNVDRDNRMANNRSLWTATTDYIGP